MGQKLVLKSLCCSYTGKDWALLICSQYEWNQHNPTAVDSTYKPHQNQTRVANPVIKETGAHLLVFMLPCKNLRECVSATSNIALKNIGVVFLCMLRLRKEFSPLLNRETRRNRCGQRRCRMKLTPWHRRSGRRRARWPITERRAPSLYWFKFVLRIF